MYQGIMESRVVTLLTRAVTWIATSRPVTYPTKALWVTLRAYSVYELWDSAIAQGLVVDTLRHGTPSLSGYFGISWNGADLNKGEEGWTKGKFYVWRDTRRFGVLDLSQQRVRFEGPLDYAQNPFTILKFHLRPDERSYYFYWRDDQKDNDFQDYIGFKWNTRIAPQTLYTERADKVSANAIGIRGSLNAGINLGLLKRISYNPARFLKGIGQGVIALHMTAYLLGLSSPVAKGLAKLPIAPWAARVGEVASQYRIARFCQAAWGYKIVQGIGYFAFWYSAR